MTIGRYFNRVHHCNSTTDPIRRLLIFFVVVFFGSQSARAQANDFVTKWNLANTGDAGNHSISFSTSNAAGSISYSWTALAPATGSGSGVFTAGTASPRSITGLPTNATIELRISAANLRRFYIGNGTNRSRLIDVTQWGAANWSSMESMFYGCDNLNITSTDLPSLTQVTNMSSMFQACSNLTGPANIGNWNIANVTNMSSMFLNATAFNQSLGQWILKSSVTLTDMLSGSGMGCDNYSRTLAGWALTTSATGLSLGATGRTYGTNVDAHRTLLTTPTGSGGKGWTISGDAAASGTCGPTVYYSKSTGNLNDLASWGTSTDGSGTAPTDFTASNQYFAIRNRSTASVSGNWSTSGANSLVVLGDGTNTTTLTTGANTIAGTYKLASNTSLEMGSQSSGLSFACESGSTVTYNGSAVQTIAPGNYDNLTVSGSNTKTLSGNITVAATLSLSNKLILDAYNLNLNGSISGNSASNYIQTNSTGTVRKNLDNVAGFGPGFVFPVGNSSYNPVTITNRTGTADHFTVRVQDAVYKNGLSGTPVGTPRVDRTWQINKLNPTANAGNGVDFVFQWNLSDQTIGINTFQLNHHNGSAWAIANGSDFPTLSASYPKTFTLPGYMGSFSPFAISHNLSPLPVTWLSFTGERTHDRVQLNWSTASEQNSSHFEIERSTNGLEFTNIGRVDAAGNSQSISNYAHWDVQPLNGLSYYRLRQVDQNGAFAFSRVLQFKYRTTTAARVVPNPTNGPINLQIPTEWTGTYDCRIFNALGVLMENRRGLRTGSYMDDLSKNASGLYQVTLWENGQQIQQQWVMKK